MRITHGGPASLLLAAASLAALLASCGGTGEPAGSSAEAATVAPETSSPAASPASASAQPTTTGTPAGPAPACRTAGLGVALHDLQGAAGHVYGRIVLTNSTTAPCVITGYPGVSVVDDAGDQIGAAADRTGPDGAPVTLPPGGRAAATLAITQPGVLPGCDEPGQTSRGTRLRVYPPDDRASLLTPFPAGVESCRDPAIHQLTVGAFTAA